MSTGTDFLANLQKKTVKNTVQQKQQKRVNASAVDPAKPAITLL